MFDRDWPEALAEVTHCKTSFRSARAGGGYFMVAFRYVVEGLTYEGGFISGREYQPGETFQLRYDPLNPKRTTADAGNNWTTWYTVVFALLLGAAVAYFWLSRPR